MYADFMGIDKNANENTKAEKEYKVSPNTKQSNHNVNDNENGKETITELYCINERQNSFWCICFILSVQVIAYYKSWQMLSLSATQRCILPYMEWLTQRCLYFTLLQPPWPSG